MQQASKPVRQRSLQLRLSIYFRSPIEFANVSISRLIKCGGLDITTLLLCKDEPIRGIARKQGARKMTLTANNKLFMSLVRHIVGVVPKVFRQETSPCKFAAFASFHETTPLAVSPPMLRLGSVTFMSTGAKASWSWIRSDRTSNFSHYHGFLSYLLRPAFTVIGAEVPQLIHSDKS